MALTRTRRLTDAWELAEPRRRSPAEWQALLLDAKNRGLSTTDLARELRVSVGAVDKAQRLVKVPLGKGASCAFVDGTTPEGAVCIMVAQGALRMYVDEADAASLLPWRWRVDSNGYAYRTVGTACGPTRTTQDIYVHRVLCSVEPAGKVDHVNRNRLDNRRSNLRPASAGENADNASIRKDNTSGVKGVSWDKRCAKWSAQIQHRGQYIWIGYFDTKEEAATAYRERANELKGDYACPDRR